jgi:hypothetical protein
MIPRQPWCLTSRSVDPVTNSVDRGRLALPRFGPGALGEPGHSVYPEQPKYPASTTTRSLCPRFFSMAEQRIALGLPDLAQELTVCFPGLVQQASIFKGSLDGRGGSGNHGGLYCYKIVHLYADPLLASGRGLQGGPCQRTYSLVPISSLDVQW